MRLEALRSLLRVRSAAVESAQRALAEAIRREREASSLLAQSDEAITREAEAAMSLSAGDGAVEAYARWLPTGRRAAAEARTCLDRAAHEVGLARTAVGLARAAEKALAGELTDAEKNRRHLRAAREQIELDDVGARSATGRTGSANAWLAATRHD